MHVCVYIHMYICVYVCMCVYTYTNILKVAERVDLRCSHCKKEMVIM